MVVNFPPTTPGEPGYSLTHTEPSGVTWEYDGEKWRVTGGSGGSGGGGGSSYGDDDVDAHLNTDSATNNQVLSWTGLDYDWVDQSAGGGGGDLTKAAADTYYLSKTGDDTAAGNITFQGFTTHEIGLAATTGSIQAIAGGVTAGANPVNGVADGARLVQTGILAVSRSVDSSPLFNAYKTGTTEPVITMWNDGRAYFSGDVDIEAPFTPGDASNPLLTFARAGGAVKGVTGYDASVPAIYTGTVTPHKFQIRVNNNIAQTINTDSSVYFAGKTLQRGYFQSPSAIMVAAASDPGDINDPIYSVNPPSDGKVGIALRKDGQILSNIGTNNSPWNIRRDNDGKFLAFSGNNNTEIGNFRMAGGAIAGPSTSDYRTKNSISALPSATAQIAALNPVSFEYNHAPGYTHTGFVAHELQDYVPEAVFGIKDAAEAIGTHTDAEGVVTTDVTEPETLPYGETWVQTGTRPVYQGVDQTKLIPLLTKALQETIAKNEDLEARLAALEGA